MPWEMISYGKFVDEDFIHHGLDTSYLKKREGKTTNFDIVLSNRETMGRCILSLSGTAEQLQAEDIPLEYPDQYKIFVYFYAESGGGFSSRHCQKGWSKNLY